MTQKSGSHEAYVAHSEAKIGRERSFGVVFAVVFAIIGGWSFLGGGEVRVWALIIGALFLCAAFVVPSVLKPLNILWFKFGLVLSKIVNPVIMFLLYITTIVPIGLLMRLFGKDPLYRKFDKQLESYWIERTPPGPEPDSMKNQF